MDQPRLIHQGAARNRRQRIFCWTDAFSPHSSICSRALVSRTRCSAPGDALRPGHGSEFDARALLLVIASAATCPPKPLAKAEAIQSLSAAIAWIASSQGPLAMTEYEAPAGSPISAVIPREGGESSTPRLPGSITTAPGILDRSPSRAMTPRACKHVLSSSRLISPELCFVTPPLEAKRVQGRPGADLAPAVRCAKM